MVNLLRPGIRFLYSLKLSEERRFSNVFQGFKKGTPGSNGLA